ncbi:MAG: phage head closure protein [Novosphingobium sp.]
MSIDPATMNRRVVVERYTLVPGPLNDEFAWADIRSVWAAMKYDRADEEFAAHQTYARRLVTFTMRFTHDLTAVDRLRHDGVTYEIKGITEVGFREAIEVKAEATDPGGV